MRPLIGITTNYNDRKTQYMLPYGYAASVEKAGGLPFLLPYKLNLDLIPQIVDRLDGILFSGGNDLDPATYEQQLHPQAVPIDPDRQKFEMALLAEVERKRKPALGVCLGCQLFNVHRGGKLIQFLPDVSRDAAIEHRRFGLDWSQRHPIHIEKDSSVAQALGKTEIIANSSHKQAIQQPGKGLRVIATAPDGVIEGIEDPSLPFFVGVQWHPERMSDEEDHLKLFRALVEASSSR